MSNGTILRTDLAAQVVAAYVSNNAVPIGDLADLIVATNRTFAALGEAAPALDATKAQSPAVPVGKSVTKEYVVCLEDGKKFKSLRRHLRTAFNMTPEQYRAKWGLPANYPMVAPAYSAVRSGLAKEAGLGRVAA